LSALSGIVTGFLLHYYQTLLRKGKIKRLSLYVLDISLWLFLLPAIFFVLLIINFAEIRLYIFLALLSGILAYFYFLSAWLSKVVAAWASLTIRCLRIIIALLTWPQRYIVQRQKKKAAPDDKDEDSTV
jgi:spore cortex biosynthesis protein YabQ